MYPGGIQVAIGQVHGTVNGVMLPDVLLLANITKTQGNATRINCQVTGLPGPIRNWLQAAIPLTTPVYWAASNEGIGAINGLTLTKGDFTYKTRMDFDSGESLFIEHRAQGVNDQGVLVMDINIKGKTPMFPSHSKIKHESFNEEFVQTGAGQIRSASRRRLEVNGLSVPYSCNSTVTYSPKLGGAASLTHSLKATEVGVHNPDGLGSESLNFDVTAAVERGKLDVSWR